MEESSKILKLYSSQWNGLQLRYLNRKYTKKNRSNRQIIKITISNTVPTFLAVTLILGGQYLITEPLSVFRSNDKHIESCTQKDDSYFTNIEELHKIKEKIQPNTKLQQLYEQHRAQFKSNNPDYNVVIKEFVPYDIFKYIYIYISYKLSSYKLFKNVVL